MPRPITNILPGFPNADGLSMYRALYLQPGPRGAALAGLIAATDLTDAEARAREDAERNHLIFDQIDPNY